MNRLPLAAGAALGVLHRDLLIFVSYRLRFLAIMLSSFFSLTLFYYLSRLLEVSSFESPDAYYAFAVVGLVVLQIMNSTLSTPPTLVRQELVAGTFERMVVSPFGPVRSLISMLLFPLASALVTALVMLAFAGVVFGLELRWETALLALPLGALGALAFAPFGILLLAIVIVAKQTAGGATWLVAGMSLLAGLYFPVALLPDWIQWASEVQPFTPATELLRNVLVGTPLSEPVMVSLAKVAGFAAVLLPAASWLLARAVRVSRKRGTIIEY